MLGVGVVTIYNYESGRRSDIEKPVVIPRVVSLAAAALAAGLTELKE